VKAYVFMGEVIGGKKVGAGAAQAPRPAAPKREREDGRPRRRSAVRRSGGGAREGGE
jgi:small subunit ribosomal protein S3